VSSSRLVLSYAHKLEPVVTFDLEHEPDTPGVVAMLYVAPLERRC